ncbi:FAD-dependent oxidoreductase [Siansivirga zeaxanthinifaciens]|uniref:Pyridine nucleotide-disulfide oxidoreductase n=1 Tax=Siansivirga zeaxanthinifaciens CC-SAMT-1 TaxID=1454006 RepID=A0A0C5WJM5_9FLAO|nr:FAD-dependent oxidoreductase [Siansivirga zeaxanthinifaciens]AJR02950.1 pyridine nucleotide-disulfide oxidoreductase [Siansivirga zeaxanthinifaciens CC-SAMT-1]
MFDALIIGGGAAGLSCALVLGSAKEKAFAKNKRIGIVIHQKTSHLQTALFNNVLGLEPGTLGANILKNGKKQLAKLYPHVEQIDREKVLEISKIEDVFLVQTNKNSYQAKIVVVAVGYTNLMSLKGLESYIAPHPRSPIEKDRIWLKNTDHIVDKNLYVAGSLAGWRSQFAICAGSGTHVATDILTLWNGGNHTKVHDKIAL